MSTRKIFYSGTLCSLAALLFVLLPAFRPGDEKFSFPLRGLTAISLSGSFGELRNNHFHSGLDIRTDSKTGLPVYAAMDGYVSRIRILHNGFGKAVYITHPNRLTSVYAHLEDFPERIRDFVQRKQYGSRQFLQDLYPSPQEITVNEGEIIAFSGNTGSSSGPHLHFEIRDEKEYPYNPLLFGFSEIKDSRRPVFLRVAFEPLEAHSRVNGRFDKKVIPVFRKDKDIFFYRDSVFVQGPFGIEIQGVDYHDASFNSLGIYQASCYLDDSLVFAYTMEKFGFHETRCINVHFDYSYFMKKNIHMERMYREDGNILDIYTSGVQKGILTVSDNKPHVIKVTATDLNQNSSNLTGTIFPGNYPGVSYVSGRTFVQNKPRKEYEIHRNVLIINALDFSAPEKLKGTLIFHPGYPESADTTEEQAPAYFQGNKTVFLYDLRKFPFPPRAFVLSQAAGDTMHFPFRKFIYPDLNDSYTGKDIEIIFPKNSLFDTIPLMLRESPPPDQFYSKLYAVHDPLVPVFSSVTVRIRPAGYPDILRDKLCIVSRTAGVYWEFAGNTWESDYLAARVKKFGTFAVRADVSPPTVRNYNFINGETISKSRKTLELRIADNLSGIDENSIQGYIDEQWVLFEYDQKTQRIIHPMRYPVLSKGRHTLKIFVRDKTGNEEIKIYSFYTQ